MGNAHIDRVVGTSATASAVVCAANQIPRARRDEADRHRATTAQIRRLYRDICGMDLAARQRVTGIGPKRAEIIVPGAAVLMRVLEAFNMPALFYSIAGVRDGIISDLAARGIGRSLTSLNPDQRATVEHMAERYGVSLRHARRVAKLCGDLFLALTNLHKLPAQYGRMLEAAAYLHDIGHFVSDTRHHKHSYYLVANSDMPGFTEEERELVANLCRYHRKAAPTAEHSNLHALDSEAKRAVSLLMPLLRLADSLDRSHEQRVKTAGARVRDHDVLVTLHAAPEADLDLEVWAAERTTDIFQAVYGKPLSLSRVA
jgi:exopolyphosphatase/guanosine-5'-triphosphate,3'-diphosphate pyrophosphatase